MHGGHEEIKHNILKESMTPKEKKLFLIMKLVDLKRTIRNLFFNDKE